MRRDQDRAPVPHKRQKWNAEFTENTGGQGERVTFGQAGEGHGLSRGGLADVYIERIASSCILRAAMKPRLTPLSKLAIFTLALFTVFITWRAKAFEKKLLNKQEVSELVGKSAPDFTLYTLEGQKVSLADYRGKKKVVISFWASWCGPCRMEMPALRDFYKKNQNRLDEFEMLAIDVDDDDPGDAEAASKSDQLPFPVLLDRAGKAGRAYDVDGIPAMFIVDEGGVVRYEHEGFDATLELALAVRLGFGPPATLRPGQVTVDGDSSH